MKNRTRTWISGTLLVLATNFAFGESVSLKWRYQNAESGQLHRGENGVVFNANRNYISDAKMEKSLFVLKLGNVLKGSLEDFHKACEVKPLPRPIPMPRPILPGPHPIQPGPVLPGPIVPEPPVVPSDCEAKRIKVSEALLASIDELSHELDSNRDLQSAQVYEVLDLGRKLAKNMKEAKDQPVWHLEGGGFGGGPIRALSSIRGGGLNVTAGGAQDFGFFRKVVEDGRVPHKDNLTIEGFLSEFDLSLSDVACDELICVHPAVKIDADNSKMFLQIGMNSNVTKANFERKPLNLSIVLDISGSMSARDNTEKSRLEWAKDAVIKTVNELNEEDYLSIVLFDTKSEVLLPSARVEDKEAIIAMVKELKTKGSTNLEAGLTDGYQQVSKQAFDLEGYDNRVILVSDAGLNTGVTDQAAVLKTITDFANENIGLTAIGLGLNFNQDFIHGITQSRGGNYIFVHSGKDMFRYFESFNFLVTPVAYNFKVALDIAGVDAKLVKAYGVPASEEAPVRELIDIQTLFFSEAGGAIVLEYDLKAQK